MKLFLAVLGLFTVLSARAQYVPPSPTESAMEAGVLQQQIYAPNVGWLNLQPLGPNEMMVNGRTYSGSLVELVKTRQPLQLINPRAQNYGTAEDNTVRDDTGRATGLKLFSISF